MKQNVEGLEAHRLPYPKENTVITFSVKLYYIYGWSVYYI